MQPFCRFSQGRGFLLSYNCRKGRQHRAEVSQQRARKLAQVFWCICVCPTAEVLPKALPRLKDGGAQHRNPPCQTEQGGVLLICLLKPSEQTVFKNINIEKLSHKSDDSKKLWIPRWGPNTRQNAVAQTCRDCQVVPSACAPTAAHPCSCPACHSFWELCVKPKANTLQPGSIQRVWESMRGHPEVIHI